MSISTFPISVCIRSLLVASAVFPYLMSGPSTHGVETSKVDQVLADESAGKPINRRKELVDQKDEASQWQAGRILLDGKWLDMEAMEGHSLEPQTLAYRQHRDGQTLDVEGHRKMAIWCQTHQLPEMAQVHWKAVIAVAVDDEQARKELGHKLVGSSWFSNDELTQAATDQKQETLWLKEWMPKIRKILTKLQSSEARTKLEGMKDLEKIDTVAAVIALKYAAIQVGPSIALPIVAKIKALRSKAACLALCEIAISNPNSDVGRLAVEGLKEYDEHFYVPELLQMLEMPITMKQQCVYLPNGSLAIQRAYTRETANSKEQISVLKLVTLPTSDSEHTAPFIVPKGKNKKGKAKDDGVVTIAFDSTTTTPVAPKSELGRIAASNAEMLSKLAIRDEQRNTEKLNEMQRTRERNAKYILSIVSGLPADRPSDIYWSWWPMFNDAAASQKANINQFALDNSEYVTLQSRVSANSSNRLETSGTLVRRGSCLVAGTLVQTSEGLKCIESLKVGDDITSIDVRTGKIGLFPATHVTERTADSTYKISVASSSTIRATGGHHWWIVGRGWVRSRDLAAGQFMRTGDSSVQITKVEKIDEPIKVYNMIVDENHTYFVGKDRLLSWDVTSLQPTLQTAPGQTTSTYVSKK